MEKIIIIIWKFPGVEDGQTVRMTLGKREVFITFRIEKSSYFRRDGCDIHTDATISLSQAVLGGTIRVQGIYEDQTIQVGTGMCIMYDFFFPFVRYVMRTVFSF